MRGRRRRTDCICLTHPRIDASEVRCGRAYRSNTPRPTDHNLAPAAFVWLWAKYVTGSNPEKHCTYSILGKYSKRLSAHNELLGQSPSLTLDEEAARDLL